MPHIRIAAILPLCSPPVRDDSAEVVGQQCHRTAGAALPMEQPDLSLNNEILVEREGFGTAIPAAVRDQVALIACTPIRFGQYCLHS